MKVGDKVHVGYMVKGGSGVEGVVEKIEGDYVHIKNPEGRTFKGLQKNTTVENKNISSAFQNARQRALVVIRNKCAAVGVTLANVASTTEVDRLFQTGVKDGKSNTPDGSKHYFGDTTEARRHIVDELKRTGQYKANPMRAGNAGTPNRRPHVVRKPVGK
jgi:hypothetical protein